MRYRLSTMMIVVAVIAVVFTQHASPVRFTIAATIASAVGVAWIAAKGFPFPWKAAFALVAVGDLLLVASSYYTQFKEGSDLSIGQIVAAPFIAFVLAILLAIPVGLLFVFYLMADSFFGRDREDLPAGRRADSRKSSD
jgi:drug/metabolite transporter (DMT)-like permease